MTNKDYSRWFEGNDKPLSLAQTIGLGIGLCLIAWLLLIAVLV